MSLHAWAQEPSTLANGGQVPALGNGQSRAAAIRGPTTRVPTATMCHEHGPCQPLLCLLSHNSLLVAVAVSRGQSGPLDGALLPGLCCYWATVGRAPPPSPPNPPPPRIAPRRAARRRGVLARSPRGSAAHCSRGTG